MDVLLIVEIHVQAGVYEVEAAHPEGDAQKEQSGHEAQVATHGHPRARRRATQDEAQEQVRRGGEALGIAVEDDYGRHREGKREREGIEHPGREDEERQKARQHTEDGFRMQQRLELGAVFRPRVFGVDVPVGEAVERHGEIARANRRRHHPEQDPRRGDPAGRHHAAHEHEGKAEDGVLELHHAQELPETSRHRRLSRQGRTPPSAS